MISRALHPDIFEQPAQNVWMQQPVNSGCPDSIS
jgi:hypothetical protein